MHKDKPTICLNMIVKDESKVITRCLDSVKDFIDYWVISDTGSTDGTQQIIQDYFQEQGIKGELQQNEWKNFAHNRNLALEGARNKCDYILLMDADDYLVTTPKFSLNELNQDCYMLLLKNNNLEYFNIKLIRATLPWYWEGILHEYLECDTAYSRENLTKDCYIASPREGNRSNNPNKYQDDAKILAHAVIDEPDNARYRFYLAQSHRDYNNYTAALENYQKRIAMGGWEEEVWYSYQQAALMKEYLDYPQQEVLQAYLDAYEYRPQRAESLYHLARYLRQHERYELAYVYAFTAAFIPMSEDALFVSASIYEWQAKDELAVAAYWTGNYQLSIQLCEELLAKPKLPAEARSRIQANKQYAIDQIEHYAQAA